MERLRIFLKKAFSYPALLQKTHPVTTGSVLGATVLFAVYYSIRQMTDYTDTGFFMELFFCLCMACMYFSVFALCIESIRPHWSTKAGVAVFAAFGILSLFMGLILSDIGDKSRLAFFNFIEDLRFRTGTVTIILYVLGLMALAILLAMYFSYSRDVTMKFNTHVFSACSRIFFSSIIYGIIQMGVLFLTLIVSVLLYEEAFEYLPTILILINGLFFVPAVLYALTHENDHANKFMEVIVRYVSLIITMIGFAIIYIYMIKLIVTASVPSNSVYEILAALFVISMFISYMCTSFEDKGLLQKFAYNCPVLFTPFIIMQGYTAFVRISQYGLTPKRYFGIAFMLFEIVYIIYYIYVRKTEKETMGSNILLIMCAFLIICIFVPGVNAKSLSTTVAKHRLSSYLEKSSKSIPISDREYVRINAAYGFLKDDDFGGDRLVRYFPDLTEDTVSKMKEDTRTAAKNIKNEEGKPAAEAVPNRYGYYDTNLGELGTAGYLDISGYSQIADIRINDSSIISEDSPVDTTKLNVYSRDYNNDTPFKVNGDTTIDLSEFCDAFAHLVAEKEDKILTDDEFNSRCRKLCIIDINENVRICITDANITIDQDNRPTDVNLDGFVLIR